MYNMLLLYGAVHGARRPDIHRHAQFRCAIGAIRRWMQRVFG
ncbi:MAG: hypothetical protein ACR2PO_13545 [Methyloligellaceae bacterium]